MKENEIVLPEGWRMVRADELGNLLRGINYKKEEARDIAAKGYIPVLRANNIDGRINYENLVYVPISNVDKEQRLRKGDILFAMSSGSKHLVGKSARVLEDFDGSFGAFCGLFRTNGTASNLYITYFFQGPVFKRAISEIATGTNINNLKRGHILDTEIPLPPIDEQHRIVSKIEELFSELEKGKEQILLAQQQLKTYRQAVLKWAFEGRLTSDRTYATNGEQFLESLRQKNIEALRQDLSNGHEEAGRILKKNSKAKPKTSLEKNAHSPSNWVTASLIEACLYVVDCHNKTAPYVEKGVHLIRTSNIKHGKFILDEKMRYVDEPTYIKWSKRCPPKENDILFTREAPMGESAIVPQGIKVCMGQRMMLFRTVGEVLLPKYLHYAILEPSFQKRLESAAIGTGVKHLRVGDVEQLRIPICSTEEQQRIVQEIESRLSVCDAMEATLQTSLAQAEVLRQSILKLAFEGRLG